MYLKERILAIYDDYSVYAELLLKQFIRMEEGYFHICKFATEEQLYAYARKNEIVCLLCSETYEGILEPKNIGASCYLYLTQEPVKARIKKDMNTYGKIGYVYRFQSCEQIMNKIIEEIKPNQGHGICYMEEASEVQLIGVYNPVHRNGQTTFAKALATAYSEQGIHVLYLNLEEFSGEDFNHTRGGDLGEVIYYMKQDIKSINFRLASFVKNEGGYDRVPAIEASEELKKITVEEWCNFLQEIKDKSGYEIIVLDLDSCLQGLLAIMEKCMCIYMPIRESVGGESKRNQFMNNLKKMGKNEIVSKFIMQEIPEFHDSVEEEYAKIFGTTGNGFGANGFSGICIG